MSVVIHDVDPSPPRMTRGADGRWYWHLRRHIEADDPDARAKPAGTRRPRTRTHRADDTTRASDQTAQLMTTNEVAEHLRTCAATVLRLIAKGCLRSLRIGKRGHHRVRRVDLDAYLATHSSQNRTDDDLLTFIKTKTG